MACRQPYRHSAVPDAQKAIIPLIPMALATGSRLGPYEITALIGQGGMGEGYRATNTELNRQVALKTLSGGRS